MTGHSSEEWCWGPWGRAGSPRSQAEDPLPPPAQPAATFQPHELVVALLAQLQFPAVLAQQLLVVAVDFLNGLADLVGGGQHRQAGQAALTNCPELSP